MSKRPSLTNVTGLNRRPMMADQASEPAAPSAQLVEAARRDQIEPRPQHVQKDAAVLPAIRHGARGEQAERRPVRVGKRALTFWVGSEPHRQFRMLGVREDRPGQDLLEEALDDLFAKYGMNRIARQG